MEWIALVAALVLIVAGALLRCRQQRQDRAAPLVPCDRCGRLTPATALYADVGPGGSLVERCEQCEWPSGL